MQSFDEDIATTHKLDSSVVLFYHQTSRSLHPSLFLSTHLKLLTDKSTPASSILSPHAWDIKIQQSSVSPTSVLSVDGFTPRSKKPRLGDACSSLAVNHDRPSRDKSHFRKKHFWAHPNTFEFQEIYTRAAPAKIIPTPGVYLIDEPDEIFSQMQYVRDSTHYHKEVGTEVERAMEPTRVVYDMDSSDEEWFKTNNGDAFGEDIFEHMMDSLEKFAYTRKHDELTIVELEEIASKFEQRDFIKDVYKYWRGKRQKTGLPLIRQFQPPLWEVYQKQVRDWELSTSRLHTSLSDDLSDKAFNVQRKRPPPFAFCLKPRGLEFLNKGAKPRPHKKSLKSGSHCCSSPRELDTVLYAFGNRPYESFTPLKSNPSNILSPDTLRTGVATELVETRRHCGIIQSPRSRHVGSDMSESKLHDASHAAIHAAKIAKLKREKAQLLLQKADLAVYKAAHALIIADAVVKSGKEITNNLV